MSPLSSVRKGGRSRGKELALKRSSLTLVGLLIVTVVAVAPAAGTSTQTPKRGGTLVIAVPSAEPACLSVLDVTCENPVAEKVLESPFVIDRDFTFQARLVTGVPYTTKRPFTLTYHIRPEARWSDGVPVTARDFVFTLRAIRTSGGEDARKLHSVVRSIRAVDAKTVRVVLSSKSAGWRGLFPLVLPAHALRGEDLTKVWVDNMDNPQTGRPIGSGPFLVDHWERGKELVLRRNPNYWGSHPAYLDRIVMRFIESPSERLEAFEAGGIDVMQGVPPQAAPALRRTGTPVSATPAFGFEHFELNLGPGGHPALRAGLKRNKLVRQALVTGIDRPAIVREIWGEFYPGLRPLDSAVLLSQNRFYRANWSRYRFRPAQARRLLERAGCSRGSDGIYSCGGERLSLRFVTTAGVPVREQVLRLVQAQLLQVGVEVRPAFTASFSLLLSGDFDAFLFTDVYSPDSTGIASVFGCGRNSNFSGYCQRLVTEELDESERILDERQRARVLNRADRQLARDVPVIPLYPFVVSSARSAAVRGYVVHPSGPLWNAEDWWLDR